MEARPRLTPAQRRALQEAAEAQREVTFGWTRGQAMAAWERMMDRLCKAGLMRVYPHGGYEITEAGRREAEALKGKTTIAGNGGAAEETGDAPAKQSAGESNP